MSDIPRFLTHADPVPRHPGTNREAIIAAATEVHDAEGCGCDRKYLMSCPRMAAAVLRVGVAVETDRVAEGGRR